MPAPTKETLIDAVDAADEPIATVERGRALKTRRNFRVAHVFVFNLAGELLLQQLSSQRERHPLRWGSSVAAYLYAGEPDWAGARRRLREELGLLTQLRKHGTFPMRDGDSLKFVSLFTTPSERARVREPTHIERIEFRELSRIDSEIERDPVTFTPTFLQTYSFFRATQSLVQ